VVARRESRVEKSNMQLRFSPTSPYVRKVVVTAHELGLADRVELITTNPWVPDPALFRDNPLGKVPALTTDEGDVLFDSPVICEYLESLAGPRLFPDSGRARWQALRLQALGDGLLDAAVLWRLETQRPADERSSDWQVLQQDAVSRALDALEHEAAHWAEDVNIGHVTVACALGYLDFRFASEDWREEHPTLAAWYQDFAARPSMVATVPKG
jgi:glutathione S-transferase